MTDIPVYQKKQYLLMLDEVGMAMLSRLSPAFSFVQVEGMPLEQNPAYQVLVSPLIKPEDHNADVGTMVEDGTT